MYGYPSAFFVCIAFPLAVTLIWLEETLLPTSIIDRMDLVLTLGTALVAITIAALGSKYADSFVDPSIPRLSYPFYNFGWGSRVDDFIFSKMSFRGAVTVLCITVFGLLWILYWSINFNP